jgi:orotate phosphoribosyltransferase-like protein
MKNKREIWIKHIQDYRSSGLAAAKWCKQNGVNKNTLKYYITKFNKEKKQQESNQVKWASILPHQSKITVNNEYPIKVTIGHSTIEVLKGFDPTTFKTIVGILSEQC